MKLCPLLYPSYVTFYKLNFFLKCVWNLTFQVDNFGDYFYHFYRSKQEVILKMLTNYN